MQATAPRTCSKHSPLFHGAFPPPFPSNDQEPHTTQPTNTKNIHFRENAYAIACVGDNPDKTTTSVYVQQRFLLQSPDGKAHEVAVKPAVVTCANAVPDERAMVIEGPHAAPAAPAVLRS